MFVRKHMLMNILNEGGDAGGGSTGGQGSTSIDPGAGGTSSTGGSTNGGEVFTPPEWAKGVEGLDIEMLKAPMFQTIKSNADLIKGYYNAQKLVGADKAIVPGKGSSPEQWKEYYIKAGLPATMEDYKAEFPATIEDKEFQANLTKKAYELNVRPDQLQAIVAEMEGYNDKIVQNYEAEEKATIENTAKALQQEWGADYKRNLMGVQRVIEHFGGKEMLTKVMQSPLVNDGDFLRLMQKVSGKLTREDTFQQDVVARFGTSAEEASKQINAIYGDSKSPYYDENHAQHKDYVSKMLELQKIISESSNKA